MNKLVFLLLLASPLLPQQSPNKPPPAQPGALSSPTFQTRTDLVLVPVVVRNRQGKHIAGLAKDAFRLEENGKDQIVSVFEEVQSTTDPSPLPASDLGYSNLPFDNTHELRLIILLLDLLNTTAQQRTAGKEDLIKFLSKGLVRNQPVSVLCVTPDGLRLVHPFTADSTLLIQAVKKVPIGALPLMPVKERARETLRQIREIAHAYAGIPGRKTLIFAAGNIPDPQIDISLYDDRLAAMDSFQQTFDNLIDANIAVYPIQLMAWAVYPGARANRPNSSYSGETTLQEFAAATGGNRCLESNEVAKCLADAVEDSRSYYLLGFSIRPDDRKPGWHDLKVKVSAEHADVRARSGFYYGSSGASGSQPTVHDAEINALASPLAYSSVPMFVRVLPPAAASPAATPDSQDKKTTVEFLVTIPLGSVKIDPSSANPLDLEIGGIALTAKIRKEESFSIPCAATPMRSS